MSSTILFVDDHNILYRSGTRRVLNSPIRHDANPLITPDRPWETAIAWTSVCRNYLTGKYQLWYQSFAGDRADQRIDVLCVMQNRMTVFILLNLI